MLLILPYLILNSPDEVRTPRLNSTSQNTQAIRISSQEKARWVSRATHTLHVGNTKGCITASSKPGSCLELANCLDCAVLSHGTRWFMSTNWTVLSILPDVCDGAALFSLSLNTHLRVLLRLSVAGLVVEGAGRCWGLQFQSCRLSLNPPA